MAKPKLNPGTKTSSAVQANPKWNVIVLKDPINYTGYVVMAFMRVLRVSRPEAKKMMWEVHEGGRATVWSGDREPAEMTALELQQWHINSTLEKDG